MKKDLIFNEHIIPPLFFDITRDFISTISQFAETSVLQFFGDDFLRLLLVRYVFCDVVLNLHRSFRGRQQRPRCHPPLPDADILEHPTLHHLVLDLAACLDAREHFPDSNELA